LVRASKEIREEFEDREDKLKATHRAELRRKNERIEELQEYDSESLKEAIAEREEASEARTKAEAELAVLKKRVQTEQRQTERELELDNREAQLNARESVLDTREEAVVSAEGRIASQIERQAKDVAAARKEGEEIGEKRGFANGLADGLREVHSITAEDRKTVTSMADKAQDALIEVAKKDVPANEIKILPVGASQISNTNGSNQN
jgi:hypothetical protein